MKHIGIIGSFGSGNLGDEAAWISLQRYLEFRDPKLKYHTHIFQWSMPYQTCGHKFNLIYMLKDKEIEWINNNFKALFIVGGGIIGWKWGLTKTPNLSKILKQFTIPIYTISISAEKGAYTPETINEVKTLMTISKVFTVRDVYSQENVEALTGIKPRITPDIVSILGENYPVDRNKVDKLHDILMINASNCLTNEIIQFWKDIFIELGGNDKISCVPFAPNRNDVLQVTMSSSSNMFDFYQPEEMISIMMKKKFVIAGRLHAAVFAATAKTPFFAINYHPKVKAFCDSIGYPYYYPKENNLPIDETDYGFDLTKLNKDELISEIKLAMQNPIIPPDYHTAMIFLNEIYDDMYDIAKTPEKIVPCMYCGKNLTITDDQFILCQHCKNINYTDDVQ